MTDAQTGRSSGNLQVNQVIEANLREKADLLEQQDADGFRVQAYRRAADTIATLKRSLADVLGSEDSKGLIALPGIGPSIAAAIEEMLRTGRWAQLERLRGASAPEQLFCTVPGIGHKLSHKLHDELHLDTLEALEMAAHDGRLGGVQGFGARRVAMIKACLQERLGRRRLHRYEPEAAPSVELLLDVDKEYRERAARSELRTIAPRRFNPGGEAWLPVFHTHRGRWIFTALYSNTQRAHELDRTHDWVVIYCHTEGSREGQCTVVTETSGPQRGLRVVRGRERECASLARRSDAVA